MLLSAHLYTSRQPNYSLLFSMQRCTPAAQSYSALRGWEVQGDLCCQQLHAFASSALPLILAAGRYMLGSTPGSRFSTDMGHNVTQSHLQHIATGVLTVCSPPTGGSEVSHEYEYDIDRKFSPRERRTDG